MMVRKYVYKYYSIPESNQEHYFQETIFDYANGGYAVGINGMPTGIERRPIELIPMELEGKRWEVKCKNTKNYKRLFNDYTLYNKCSIAISNPPKITKKRIYFEAVKSIFDHWFETFHPKLIDKISPILETGNFKSLNEDYTQIEYKGEIYRRLNHWSSEILKTVIEECLIDHKFYFDMRMVVELNKTLPEDYKKSLLRPFQKNNSGRLLLQNKFIEKISGKKYLYRLNL